jgi:hypothetical protein
MNLVGIVTRFLRQKGGSKCRLLRGTGAGTVGYTDEVGRMKQIHDSCTRAVIYNSKDE